MILSLIAISLNKKKKKYSCPPATALAERKVIINFEEKRSP